MRWRNYLDDIPRVIENTMLQILSTVRLGRWSSGNKRFTKFQTRLFTMQLHRGIISKTLWKNLCLRSWRCLWLFDQDDDVMGKWKITIHREIKDLRGFRRVSSNYLEVSLKEPIYTKLEIFSTIRSGRWCYEEMKYRDICGNKKIYEVSFQGSPISFYRRLSGLEILRPRRVYSTCNAIRNHPRKVLGVTRRSVRIDVCRVIKNLRRLRRVWPITR